jgi:hypothetical protein
MKERGGSMKVERWLNEGGEVAQSKEERWFIEGGKVAEIRRRGGSMVAHLTANQ